MGFCAVASWTSAGLNQQVCTALPEICNVGDAIDSVDGSLTRALAFVKKVRQIQLRHPRVYDGRKARAGGPETLVFLTDPIPALHGGILVFVSSTVPSQVSIFSPNPDSKGVLVYDTYVKPRYFSGNAEVTGDPIEAIREIRVSERGSILVFEHTDGVMSEVARKFRLTYNDGHPRLHLIK